MKKLDKPNTFKGYFDNLENFSFYDLDSFLKIYEDYGLFLEKEFKKNNLNISQKQKPLLGSSPYKKNYDKDYKKSLTSNYNNWSDGIEFGILKKEDYLKFINNNQSQNNFLFLNIPQEIFHFFEFMPNSNLGVIKYFINYIEKNSSWDDIDFVNNKIEELDEIIPDWNHNFPIFIYTTIKKYGLMMLLTNNWGNFLSGGIHRYVCQSLNNRPTPMFIQIPSKSYKSGNSFDRNFFIDEETFLFYSGFRLFVPRKDDHELCYLVFKINIETKIVELYLTPERNNEITDKFIHIGYIDYNKNTYEF